MRILFYILSLPFRLVLFAVLFAFYIIALTYRLAVHYKRYVTRSFVYVALEANGYRRI